MELLLGLINLIVIGAVLFCMAALLLRGENTKATKVYLALQGLTVVWCSSQVLLLIASTTPQLTISYFIGNIGICFIGPCWTYFACLYSGYETKKWIYIPPFCLSAVHFFAVLTNEWHHLYYQDFSMTGITHGPLFYTHTACTYITVLVGSGILYHHMNKSQAMAKKRVIAAALIPLALNAIYLFGLIRPSFDITPLGFSISVILLYRATTKYNFMSMKRELAITNEKLLLEQERNRIAQQVHDTVGHTLTMIQSYMKLAEISASKEEFDDTKQYITEARTLTSQGIRELRESINMLRESAEYELITQGVMQLAKQVKEPPVEVTIKGEDNVRYSHLSKTVYDTVRESITNSMKYANASKIDIILRFQDKSLEVIIADDGVGCDAITESNGIRGIRERIEKAGGTVRFSSGNGEGFMTRIHLPL